MIIDPLTPTAPPFPAILGFIAVSLSWFIAQMAKVIRCWVRDRRFNFRWLFDTGGMPSSHTASVASLATVVGLYYGFVTIPFLIALIFAIITMFDAAGVRRSVGRQASILNKMMDDIDEKGQVAEERLKELLGHTPVEVLAGACLGIALAYLICGVAA
ncbi:MAG: divergent PAP2 family protein [Candidatus Omnitrophica bacterium]|nr:divergent PAP2 family protein [Candidatus Omnitrophota bacterium]